MRSLPYALLLLLFCGCSRPSATSQPPSPDLDYMIGPFTLKERSGKTITEADLSGKVWLASFIFTRCTGPCPQVTATMARLQSELAAEADLRFVTFTVDPARDDPGELRRYADHFHASPDRWLFLTGDEKTIHTLVEKQFLQTAHRKEGAKPGDEFEHSTRLALVDRKGIIRRIYPGIRSQSQPNPEASFEETMQQIRAKVRDLCCEN